MTVNSSSTVGVYDDFVGGEVNAARWRYLTLPDVDLDGSGDAAWTCFEPAAQTRVGEGTLDMYVPQFKARHRSIQAYDNLTHQLISCEAFSVGPAPVRFSLDIAATRAGDAPADFRDGFASFMVIDVTSGWSFRVCTTGHSTFGLYDSLRLAYHAKKSAQVIDSPVRTPAVIGGSLRHDIHIDGAGGSLEWFVNGRLATHIDDPVIPSRVHMALGLATLTSVEMSREHLPRPAAPGLSVSFGPVSIEPDQCNGKKSA